VLVLDVNHRAQGGRIWAISHLILLSGFIVKRILGA
jgi:hypothetical protein